MTEASHDSQTPVRPKSTQHARSTTIRVFPKQAKDSAGMQPSWTLAFAERSTSRPRLASLTSSWVVWRSPFETLTAPRSTLRIPAQLSTSSPESIDPPLPFQEDGCPVSPQHTSRFTFPKRTRKMRNCHDSIFPFPSPPSRWQSVLCADVQYPCK